jgi:hypothetical protein
MFSLFSIAATIAVGSIFVVVRRKRKASASAVR